MLIGGAWAPEMVWWSLRSPNHLGAPFVVGSLFLVSIVYAACAVRHFLPSLWHIDCGSLRRDHCTLCHCVQVVHCVTFVLPAAVDASRPQAVWGLGMCPVEAQ